MSDQGNMSIEIGRYRALVARDEAATAYERDLAASQAREQWLAERLAKAYNGCGMNKADEREDPAHWLAKAQEETK